MQLSKEANTEIIYHCLVCKKNIDKYQKILSCCLCDYRIHRKCNSKKDNFNRIDNNTYSICAHCKQTTLPFQNYTDEPPKPVTESTYDIKSYFKSINELNRGHGEDIHDDQPINCKYVDIESFNYSKDKKNLSLFHLNIGSLSKHKDELSTILHSLDYEFDIIGLTEVKIQKNIMPSFDVEIPGYNCFYTPTESAKGGSLLYVTNKLKCKRRNDLEHILYKSKELESTFIEIINPGKKNILIGSIYRHPSMDLNDFNENYLTKFMLNVINKNKNIFLMGDFNTDLLQMDKNSAISTFFDIMSSELFVPCIIFPTRITQNAANGRTTQTLIDNIYSNTPNFSEGKSGNLTITVSDHLAQFLIMPLELPKAPHKINIYRRNTKNYDRENLVLDIIAIDWKHLMNIAGKDVNIQFDIFENTINEIINKYAPLKKLTKNEIRQKLKPWITNDIRNIMKRRDSIYKKFIKAKNETLKQEYFTNYKYLRNQVVSLCRISKKNYFQTYFQKHINDIKKTWKGIKSIINIKSKIKTHPTTIMLEEKLINDPKIIANEFNTYFSNIAEKLQEKCHDFGQDYTSYIQNENVNSFFIFPTNENEIFKILKSLDDKKSEGPHSIPTVILKYIYPLISDQLCNMINLSFASGVFIERLKVSKVVPIFKDKGSNLHISNYRPISLLSNINKIIEKLMHQRLSHYLYKYNCIYDLQFGFRRNHSTKHALIYLTEQIRKALDDHNFSCGVFIDLQKAFDTVDHDILLYKLRCYGVRGIANEWFKSYLEKRRQFVNISGFNSNEVTLNYGVPQGSVLGPLLFLVYINDLNKVVKYSSTIHFADDTSLLLKNESLKQLNKRVNIDLKLLTKWLKANKISLNASKTKVLIFRHPMKKINYNLKIKIDGKVIEPVKTVEYLGVNIDYTLNWHSHVNFLIPKLTRAIGMLSKIRHFVPLKTLISIYYSIFSSNLTYASQVWGQSLTQKIKRIKNLQNKAIRIINFAGFRDRVEPLYHQLKILKFMDIIKCSNLLIVHDSLNHKLPVNLNNLFIFRKNIHNYNTRSSNMLSFPNANTTIYGIKSIEYQCVTMWNRLIKKTIIEEDSDTESDTDILEIHNISKKTFKKMIHNLCFE